VILVEEDSMKIFSMRTFMIGLFLTMSGWGGMQNVSAAWTLEKTNETCRESIDKYCKDAKQTPRSVVECLKKHESDLSSKCRSSLPLWENRNTTCKDFIEKYCGDVKMSSKDIIHCLRQHEADLSGDCRSALPPLEKKPQKLDSKNSGKDGGVTPPKKK
jgi:hypothetical protein